MITLHLEAANYDDLVKAAEQALGLEFKPVASSTRDEPVIRLTEKGPQLLAQSEATVTAAPAQASVAITGTPAAMPTQEAPPRGRRGRPRKNPETAPAAGQSTQAAPASEPVSAAAPQAQVGNSASGAPASLLPAETAPHQEPAPAPSPAPAAALAGKTEADVRAAMQEVNEKHGMERCAGILKEIGGVERIRDLKPEHYGLVIEACQKAVA